VKVCQNCREVYLTDKCPGCGSEEYDILLFPSYNNIEREEENGKEMDSEGDFQAWSP